MWKLLAALVIFYLLWRVLEKPKRVITRVPPATPNSGDTFANGTPSIAAGVGEPCSCQFSIALKPVLHTVFPVATPPPIAIQKPPAPPALPRVYTPPTPKTPTVSGITPVRPVAPIRYPSASYAPVGTRYYNAVPGAAEPSGYYVPGSYLALATQRSNMPVTGVPSQAAPFLTNRSNCFGGSITPYYGESGII